MTLTKIDRWTVEFLEKSNGCREILPWRVPLTFLIASRTLASRWARISESSQSLGPGFRALFRLRRSRRSHAG